MKNEEKIKKGNMELKCDSFLPCNLAYKCNDGFHKASTLCEKTGFFFALLRVPNKCRIL